VIVSILFLSPCGYKAYCLLIRGSPGTGIAQLVSGGLLYLARAQDRRLLRRHFLCSRLIRSDLGCPSKVTTQSSIPRLEHLEACHPWLPPLTRDILGIALSLFINPRLRYLYLHRCASFATQTIPMDFVVTTRDHVGPRWRPCSYQIWRRRRKSLA